MMISTIMNTDKPMDRVDAIISITLLMGTVIPLSFALFFVAYDLTNLGPGIVVNFIASLIYLTGYIFSRLRYKYTAKLIIFIVPMIHFSILGYLFSNETGVHLIYFFCAVVALLIFERDQIFLRTSGIVLYISCFFIVEILFTYDNSLIQYDRDFLQWLYYADAVTTFGFLIITFYFYTVVLNKSEDLLKHERERSELANRAKSDFLAKMSHELRTPLTAIIGITEMLIGDAKDQGNITLDEPLSRVHGSSNHLLGLINELLDVSKIEAGKIDLHIETFNITELTKDVTATVKPMLDTNHDTLEVKNITKKENMRSDKKRVMQILLNLLSNAAKFTENGSVTLKVKSSNEGNSEYILFDIIDTGMGIPEDKIEDMFREYIQLGSSKALKFASTGLGLSISRKLARIMGGDITAKSEYGKGSTFTLKLPVEVKAE